MSTAWTAYRLERIDRDSLKAALSEVGLDWRQVLHVTATGSLARTMRTHGFAAVPIRDLISLVTWDGLRTSYRVAGNTYPAVGLIRAGNRAAFESQRDDWASTVGASNQELRELGRDRLRDLLDRASSPPSEGAKARVGRALRLSTGALLRNLQSLAAAGFAPEDIHPTSIASEVALDAWRNLEAAYPDLFAVRESLWQNAGDIDGCLRHLLNASASERYQIVYHGFYFYTAPQWAWFQMLRRQEVADQAFVVHDDGVSDVYESWRHYFGRRIRWDMPVPQHISMPIPAPMAGPLVALQEALAGTQVHPRDDLRVVAYETKADFVAAWGALPENVQRFAADGQEMVRIGRRFGLMAPASATLANRPVGRFLTSFHRCLKFATGRPLAMELDAAAFIEMVATGVLDTAQGAPSRHLGALRRAMPFFADVSSLSDWARRAMVLRRTIGAEVSAIGVRNPDGAVPDAQRIANAAWNPFRLVPWCDLSDDDTLALVQAIALLEKVVVALSQCEGKQPSRYLERLKTALPRLLAGLSGAESQEIAAKWFLSASRRSLTLSVEGIVGIVNGILSRELGDLDDDEGDDETSAPAPSPTALDTIKELRALDSLSFFPSPDVLHVGNLSDRAFPGRASSIGWPFDVQCLAGVAGALSVSRDLLLAREHLGATGDLYLFSLALGGVVEGGEITLSWVREMSPGEQLNASPVLALILNLDLRGLPAGAIDPVVGGIHLTRAGIAPPAGAVPNAVHAPRHPPARPSRNQVDGARARIHPAAAAAACACPRRFAIQWAMGPSAAFQSSHHQQWLYGNVAGVLEKRDSVGASDARRLADGVWRQLTGAQRASSLLSRRVLPGTAPPFWEYIHILNGSLKSASTGRLDAAAKAAQTAAWTHTPATAVHLVPPGSESRYLPPGPNDASVCGYCPVRSRCSQEVRE